MPDQIFKIVLIKPSHYDEDGYVIQWWWSLVPSNSLASVHGLLSECDADKALGSDIKIEVEAYDECNTVISVKKTITAIRAAGAGFVGLVGVQSNQFPRALDLARQFRAANIAVVLGQTISVDVQLPISGVAESVTVTADSPVVDVSTTKIGTSLKGEARAWTADHYDLTDGRVATILSELRSRKE